KIGSKGLFTKEIDRALLDGRVDLAVHSLKDLPTILPEGLAVGAVTGREDVRDVFIAHPGKPAKRIDDLPAGATIATGSLRRRCQLLRWRPDLRIVDLRGNLGTRLEKLDLSDWHGIILAKAGVVRFGAGERISETVSLERILPAAGQGALAIEVRDHDGDFMNLLKPLNSEASRIATDGERALLRVLEGGCQVPVGVYGRIERNVFFLDAVIGSLDGRTLVRGQEHGPPSQSVALGIRLGKTILETGGKELLETMRNPNLQQAPEV
ncbi:MAG: hydroxymethylbilane synthase, partial [Ignavibacteria bacterium]